MEQGRLFKIVYYLLDKGRTTAPELAEKLEVSVRTIYRDLDVLSVAGIPIYTTQGQGAGQITVVTAGKRANPHGVTGAFRRRKQAER